MPDEHAAQVAAIRARHEQLEANGGPIPDDGAYAHAHADRATLLHLLDRAGEAIDANRQEAQEQFDKRMQAQQRAQQAEANEGLMLRRLSDVLTKGNAGTWDEIVHAAEQAEAKLADAMNVLTAYDKLDHAEAVARMQQAEAEVARLRELLRELRGICDTDFDYRWSQGEHDELLASVDAELKP